MLQGVLGALCMLMPLASVVQAFDWCSMCSCLVDDDPRTITFNCSRRGLTEVLEAWPSKIASTQNLTSKNLLVTFNGNNITHVPQLPPIPVKRVAFNMNRCQISSIDSAAFTNIKNIVFLDLSMNQLAGDTMRADIFRGPFNATEYESIGLETLHLGYNNIHSLDKRLFKHTPHLHTLGLNNNPLSMLDHVTAMAISSAVELQVLDLSYTGINHIPDDMFRSLKKLSQLDLSGNKFLEIPESLPLLGQTLQYFTFNGNPIERLDSDSFLGLNKLFQLEITQSKNFTRIEADAFSQLTALKLLTMNDNPRLCSIDSLAFGNLVNDWQIDEIKLHNNYLNDLPVALLPWKNVGRIYLNNNPWHCNCALNRIINSIGDGLKDRPTCMSPPTMSGVFLTEMPQKKCETMNNNEEFVAFKRGKMIITLPRISTVFIGMGFVALVAIIGVAVGLLGSYIKNKLRFKIMFQPIRYTNINNV